MSWLLSRASSASAAPANSALESLPDPVSPSLEPSLSLARAVRALGLLFGEGMSVGLCVWGLGSGPSLLPYALENKVPLFERSALLGAMFGMGVLFALLGAGYLGLRARPTLGRLHQIALRLCPLFLVGFLPFIFTWQLWQDNELTHAVLLSALGFALPIMIGTSLGAEPIFTQFSRRGSRALPQLGRRLEPWLPTVLVLIGVLGYALYFSYYSILNHRGLRSASFGLGLEENLIWNLIHGGQFMKSSPVVGPTGSLFGHHAGFFGYVIGPLYALYQRPETLLVLHSLMIGLAALPLYLLGRRYVSAWAAALVALAYLLYPPVHASNLSGFRFLPVGVFFLWLTLYLVESRRYRWAALSVLLTLSVREDLSVPLSVLGAYLIFSGRNPKAGLAIASVALAYLWVLKAFVLPRWLPSASAFLQAPGVLPAGERVSGVVLKSVLANPVSTLTSLIEEQKLLYIVQLGAPLAFLPWRRPIGWFFTLPGFFFGLLWSASLPLTQISQESSTHWTGLLFVAVLANLAWLRKPAFAGDTHGPKRQHAWAATIALLTLFTSYQYGAVFQQKTFKSGMGSFSFVHSEEDRARYAKLSRLIAKVPPRATLVSSGSLVPHVANRPNAYTLRIGLFDAEYLLASLPATGEEASILRQALSSGFGVVELDAPFLLAKRGYSQEKNAAALNQLH